MRRPYAVKLLRYIQGSDEDAYNNAVDQWAEPVTEIILGAGRARTSEASAEGHNRLVVERTLLTRRNAHYDSRDRFILPDEPDFVYEVQGVHVRADRNPFGWNPGGQLEVRRVDG